MREPAAIQDADLAKRVPVCLPVYLLVCDRIASLALRKRARARLHLPSRFVPILYAFRVRMCVSFVCVCSSVGLCVCVCAAITILLFTISLVVSVAIVRLFVRRMVADPASSTELFNVTQCIVGTHKSPHFGEQRPATAGLYAGLRFTHTTMADFQGRAL